MECNENLFSEQSVLDFNTYIMNLTAANLQGPSLDQSTSWVELYSAKKEYGLSDLSPASMDSLFQKMLIDDALFQLYFKYIETLNTFY